MTSDNLVLRPTSLAAFKSCPARWAAEHPELSMVWTEKSGVAQHAQLDPERDYAAWGTAVHSVVEQVLTKKLSKLYDEREWESAWQVYKPLKMPQREWDNAKGYAERLEHWVADLENLGYELVATEQRLEQPVPGVAWGCSISGQPDAVFWSERERSYIVLDHKTNRTYENERVWGQRLQPRAYAWLLRQAWKQQPKNVRKRKLPCVQFVIGYAVLPQPEVGAPFIKCTSWDISPESHASTEDELRDLARQVGYARQSGEWPERLNDYCGSCPLKESCSALSKAAEDTLVFSEAMPSVTASPLERYVRVTQTIKGLQGVQESLKAGLLELFQATRVGNPLNSRGTYVEGGLELFVHQPKVRHIKAGRFLQRTRGLAEPDHRQFQEVADQLLTVKIGALEEEIKQGRLLGLAHLVEEAEVTYGKPSLRVKAITPALESEEEDSSD